MIMYEIIGRVKYPDETGLAWDAKPYDEVVEFLENAVNTSDGDLKRSFKATLDELRRRWEERQNLSTIRVVGAAPAFNRLAQA